MTFLPENYKQPDNSNYLKFKDGANTFRVLSSAILGYLYWTEDKKPIRSKEPFKETPNIQLDKDGNKTKVKYFWAFVVYSYEASKIQILEITQSTVQGAIKAIVDNKQWGNPQNFDLTVDRVGEGFDTQYSVMPNPHSEIDKKIIDEYETMNINLEALFQGNDPFEATDTPNPAPTPPQVNSGLPTTPQTSTPTSPAPATTPPLNPPAPQPPVDMNIKDSDIPQ